jgi:hypothetical protein
MSRGIDVVPKGAVLNQFRGKAAIVRVVISSVINP